MAVEAGELVDEAEPVVEERAARVAPGVLEVGVEGLLGEVRVRADRACGPQRLVQVGLGPLDRLGREVVLRVGRGGREVAGQEAAHLALVLLEQAVAVVLGVALEVDDAEAVRARGQVHAGTAALGEDVQAGSLPARAGDVVPARVRRVEAGVDVLGEGVRPVARRGGGRRPRACAAWPPRSMP